MQEREPAPCDLFLSSRRRHTSYWRDWSSDVCSSDLANRGCSRASARSRPHPRHRAKRVEDDEIGRASCGKEWRAGGLTAAKKIENMWKSKNGTAYRSRGAANRRDARTATRTASNVSD